MSRQFSPKFQLAVMVAVIVVLPALLCAEDNVSNCERRAYSTDRNGVELVAICAGDFLMGRAEKPDSLPRELPRRKISIAKSFGIGKFEITRDQYISIMNARDTKKKSGLDDKRDKPITGVSWYDAIVFCNALSESEGIEPYYDIVNVKRDGAKILEAEVNIAGGYGFRLPTSAEWEYACRAGSTSAFSFGDRITDDDALFRSGKVNPTGPKTVGTYDPNHWKLHDMHGNVAEWCFDWASEDFNKLRAGGDPVKENSKSGLKTVRGGSWHTNARALECSFFDGRMPAIKLADIGFRVAQFIGDKETDCK